MDRAAGCARRRAPAPDGASDTWRIERSLGEAQLISSRAVRSFEEEVPALPDPEKEAAAREAAKASIRAKVSEGSSFDAAYVVMNILSAIVASYGLLADSAAVVIGAMIIAMLLGPISAAGLALVDGNNRLLWRSTMTVLGGVLLVLATAFVVGSLHESIPATREMLVRTAPNFLDLMIALGGGAAGAYASISPRLSTALVGVAIATALVPPLATSSMFLARGEFALSGGALLLAVTNIIAIQFASSVVFVVNGFHQMTDRRDRNLSRVVENAASALALLVLGALLVANLNGTIGLLLYQNAVRRTLQSELEGYPGSYLADVRFTPQEDRVLVRAVVRSPKPFAAPDVAAMERALPERDVGVHTELRIRHVSVEVMSASGPVYSAEDTGPGDTR